MINSILVRRPTRASRTQFHEAVNIAIQRAQATNKNIGVFEDRKGKLHIQNIGLNPVKYFGRAGILYSTQVAV